MMRIASEASAAAITLSVSECMSVSGRLLRIISFGTSVLRRDLNFDKPLISFVP